MTDHLDQYPDAPGFKAHGTSELAAQAVKLTAKTLRALVLREIKAAGVGGLTADEIASRLNRSVLSVRPRVSELNRQGEIRQSGARRRNDSGMLAAVWVAAPPIPGGVNG